MQKEKLENLIKDFSLEKLSEFLWDANFEKDKQDFSFLNPEDIFAVVQKLGEVKTDDNKKIIVATAKVRNDLSERSSRKKQYSLGKKILDNHLNCQAGIFVFYDKQGSFRFSLIYPTYEGTKRVLNSFKRYTYFVSKEQTNKTFLSQIGDGDFSTLDKIKDAFSVEKVTKEFFKEYKKLFEKLNKYFKKDKAFAIFASNNKINIENFSKKLLGQIVFIYFLQKKGCLGAKKNQRISEGDGKFLRNLFNKCVNEKKNFFNDCLEYLFYDSLNRKPEKAGSFYRDYFDCKIPFLNGGLFEPLNDYNWKNEFLNIPNEIFSNSFQKDGDGILDVFDLYNFTVDENSLNDQEVSIDPEMLGKVFENLLSENLRKGKGTYYTPREIVHYMCQESLTNYILNVVGVDLCVNPENAIKYNFTPHSGQTHRSAPTTAPTQKDIATLIKHNETKDNSQIPKSISKNAKLIDEKLASIKVCDPACGSGAFLVGMLQEIIKTRQILQPFINKETSEYNLKKETIQNCIYGVDIDPGAIEIAKLRLWLSLVVDYDLEGIEPLPNLDYKIMQGNSLLEEFEGVKFCEDENDLYKQLNELKEYKEEIKVKRNKNQKKVLDYYKINYKQDKQLEKETIKLSKENESIQKNIIKLQNRINILADNTERKTQKEELKNKKLKYFSESDRDKKDKLKQEINDLIDWFVKSVLEKEKEKIVVLRKNEKKKIEQLRSQKAKDDYWKQWSSEFLKEGKINELLEKIHDPKTEKPFFLWRLNFMEVFKGGGFDVVIANPPYIKEYTNKSVFDGLKNNPYYQGKMDLWYFFGAMGLDLLKDGGIETYISPNNWTTNAGASKFRNKILNDSVILTFLDFGNYKIFESAGIQTMVYVLKKNSEIKKYSVKFGKLLNDKVDGKSIEEFINSDFNIKNDEFVKYKVGFKRDKFKNKNVIFLDNSLSEIFKKIKEQADFYLTEKEVAQGMVFPQDCLNKKNQQILGNSYKIGDGIFVLSNAEKNKLNLIKKELELIKPYYTTKQIHKWQGDLKNKEWIIYTDSKFKNPKNIKPYPNIKKHLDKFQKVITSSNKPYGLHRARDEKFFKDEKIIVARKCAEPQFCYTDFDCYVSATFYVIKTERSNLKYLTALLNSKLIKFWLKNQGKMQGDNYQIDKEPLLNLPLKIIDAKQQKPFIKLVDQILEKKKDNPKADVGELEREIDGMVYELYGLSKEEIGIVEKSS